MEIKRLLTNDEINDILSVIKIESSSIPFDTSKSIRKKLRLSVKSQLKNKKIYPAKIPNLKKEIELMYNKTKVQAGEMVGILAAQSIGEKQTQNSIAYDEKVILMDKGILVNTSIGSYIDKKMKNNKITLEDGSSQVQEIRKVKILTVSKYEKVEWRYISEISRHLPKGNLVTVKTKSGREVTTTLSHSHLRRSENGIVPVLGSDLKIGDHIPIVKKSPFPITRKRRLFISEYLKNYTARTRDDLWFDDLVVQDKIECGVELADFTGRYFCSAVLQGIRDYSNLITPIEFKYSLEDELLDLSKKVFDLIFQEEEEGLPDFVFNCRNREFTKLVLKSWIESSNSFYSFLELSGVASNLKTVYQFAFLFSYFGVVGKINKFGDNYKFVIQSKESYQIYLYDICNSKSKDRVFIESLILTTPSDLITDPIPFSNDQNERINCYFPLKKNKNPSRNRILSMMNSVCCPSNIFLELNREYNKSISSEVLWDPIVEIVYVKEKDYNYKYVYDFSVPKNETFALNSGILVHNTLNTFHRCGVSEKSVTLGVPRFSELINCSKNPKNSSCFIYFKDGPYELEELQKVVGYNIKGMKLKDLILSCDFYRNKEKEKWHKAFSSLFSDEVKENNEYNNYITYKLDMTILREFKLSLGKVCEVINNIYTDLFCIYSPDNMGLITVFINTDNIKPPLEDDKKTANEVYINEPENYINVYLEEVVDCNLQDTQICGIDNIVNIFYTKTDKGEWYCDTDGSNLKELLQLEIIDRVKTYSNNMWEIYNILGIEATRQFLIEEFNSIMSDINMHHVKILVERMTFSGKMCSISRYTMRAEQFSPLGRVTFEEPIDNFKKSAFFGQTDPTNGVSASILCGKRTKIGSGLCDLKIDTEMLFKMKK